MYVAISWNFVLCTSTATILNDKLSLLSSTISLDSLKAKEQWHSQTQYVGKTKSGLLTALLEYVTVLLEYLAPLVSVAGHSKDLESPGLPCTPLKKRHGVLKLC